MTALGIGQILLYAVVLILLARPLGAYMGRVFQGDGSWAVRRFGFMERGFLRAIGDRAAREQDWKSYAKTVLVFSTISFAVLYGILRLQGHLFLNPDDLAGVSPTVSFNTAVSFVTNTNWQFYGGEYTMSYLSQMVGLAVQQFLSAAVGIAVLAAVCRGFSRRSTKELGNFWVDLYRALAYVLVPLAIVWALILIGQGVVQTFDGAATVTTVEGAQQTIARGPAASMVAIKQLGSNGGGFYNSNSAVPFENPTGLSNFMEMLGLLLIPAACAFMFGRIVGAMRQAWAIFAAMFAIFVVGIAIALPAEQHGSQVLRNSGVNLAIEDGSAGGNMSDKEQRFGIANTSLWAVATTDASNGSVSGGHDALTAAGGAVPLVNMFIGEVAFGGVGSGMYGMLLYVILAVFVSGLMVGRTPEYLGKKIEARDVKIVILGVFTPMAVVLVLTAAAVTAPEGLASIFNPGPHGFTEALYAYTSQGNNNGSAFAGYGATNFSTLLGGVAMMIGRFVPLIAALAVAGSLAAKKTAPQSAGTFRTDSPTFVFVLFAVVAIVAALELLPALSLGPIVEALSDRLF